jgi:hypothetical protein
MQMKKRRGDSLEGAFQSRLQRFLPLMTETLYLPLAGQSG